MASNIRSWGSHLLTSMFVGFCGGLFTWTALHTPGDQFHLQVLFVMFLFVIVSLRSILKVAHLREKYQNSTERAIDIFSRENAAINTFTSVFSYRALCQTLDVIKYTVVAIDSSMLVAVAYFPTEQIASRWFWELTIASYLVILVWVPKLVSEVWTSKNLTSNMEKDNLEAQTSKSQKWGIQIFVEFQKYGLVLSGLYIVFVYLVNTNSI